MQKRIAKCSLLLVLLTVTSGSAAAHPRHRVRLPKDYAAWSRVARCEEGGWYAPGGFYPDALGVNATNYRAFGGSPDHGHLSLTQQIVEIRVADRLIHHYHVSIPDAYSCAAW